MHTSTKPDLTIFTPLSGRNEYWPRFSRFLEQLHCDPACIEIIFIDTSNSDEFGAMVKTWLKNSRYINLRYIKLNVGRSGLADIRRIGKDKSVDLELNFEIHRAMCKIYNTMKDVVHTPYVWVIEDDIIPTSDALQKLRDAMCPETVSVSGVYQHRYQPEKKVAWDKDKKLLSSGSGIDIIGGNGFGCVLLRMGMVRQHVFTPDKKWPDFDRAFYHRISESELVKLHWGVECEHLSPKFSVEPCPHPYESAIQSDNFHEEDYLSRYPDVEEKIQAGVFTSGYEHYSRVGLREGRIARPLSDFDEEYYLKLYPDVAVAIKKGGYSSGLEHYLLTGKREGRYSRVLKNTNSTIDNCQTIADSLQEIMRKYENSTNKNIL